MTEHRPIDGSGNNIENPSWGSAGTQLVRIVRTDYSDGLSSLAGANRPNPRDISNAVLAQSTGITNQKGASDYLWVWGQWVDHDLDLTGPHTPREFSPIPIPKGDPYFDPLFTGTQFFPFNRSIYDPATGKGTQPRQQINTQSSFIDSSNVYSASEERLRVLRTNDGTGKLKTGPEGYLPLNSYRLENDTSNSAHFYLAGDTRANEQALLTVMHSLWLLEHNRLAQELFNEPMSGEDRFQQARKIVIALNQHITFNEWLPVLLGPDGISPYTGYKSNVNPGITNIFSTACFRLGHSLVSNQLKRLDSNLQTIPEGDLSLKDAFFNPSSVTVGGGIEPLLRGAAKQACQAFDARAVDALRNFLFGDPGRGGLDLAVLNIQRGRDHGLPSYNDAREDLGLARKASFEEVSSDPETVERLASVYQSVDDIDVWVGGLSEDLHRNAVVGELVFTVLKQQFEATRDGDRFWYQNDGVLTAEELAEVQQTTFADVIRRNTRIESEIQDNVFLV